MPRRQKLPPIEELYGDGMRGQLLRGEFTQRKDVLRAIQRRHEKGVGYIDENGYWVGEQGQRWRVPFGVRAAFTQSLTFSQIASKYPFYVQWQHPSKNGGPPRTLTRSCMTLGAACAFITRSLTTIDPEAFIVVRNGFYIPTALMGKFPRKMSDGKTYYWCPRCMQPRRFRQSNPASPQSFYADKKYWSDEQDGYVWKNVKLTLLNCTHCGLSNRDQKFRSSNQPVEKVKIRGTSKRRRRARR
jgi:hypothetical protein